MIYAPVVHIKYVLCLKKEEEEKKKKKRLTELD